MFACVTVNCGYKLWPSLDVLDFFLLGLVFFQNSGLFLCLDWNSRKNTVLINIKGARRAETLWAPSKWPITGAHKVWARRATCSRVSNVPKWAAQNSSCICKKANKKCERSVNPQRSDPLNFAVRKIKAPESKTIQNQILKGHRFPGLKVCLIIVTIKYEKTSAGEPNDIWSQHAHQSRDAHSVLLCLLSWLAPILFYLYEHLYDIVNFVKSNDVIISIDIEHTRVYNIHTMKHMAWSVLLTTTPRSPRYFRRIWGPPSVHMSGITILIYICIHALRFVAW